jgi:CDP-glucose 4,6-dehydratase
LTVEEDPHAAEAAELRLDCDLARRELGWRAVWNTPRAVAAAVEWYRRFYADPARDASPDCLREIEAYTADARALGLPWAAAG